MLNVFIQTCIQNIFIYLKGKKLSLAKQVTVD